MRLLKNCTTCHSSALKWIDFLSIWCCNLYFGQSIDFPNKSYPITPPRSVRLISGFSGGWYLHITCPDLNSGQTWGDTWLFATRLEWSTPEDWQVISQLQYANYSRIFSPNPISANQAGFTPRSNRNELPFQGLSSLNSSSWEPFSFLPPFLECYPAS